MKGYQDISGKEWDVVVGRESWGTVVALFLPRNSSDPPRQALMEVSSADEGNRLLLEMTAEEVEALFLRTVQKPTR